MVLLVDVVFFLVVVLAFDLEAGLLVMIASVISVMVFPKRVSLLTLFLITLLGDRHMLSLPIGSGKE